MLQVVPKVFLKASLKLDSEKASHSFGESYELSQ